MTLILAVYGTSVFTKHRDGIRRWRRSPSENISVQKDWQPIFIRIHMGYIHTNNKGIECYSSAQNYTQRRQSTQILILEC
jgi:hypothetical protein